MSSISTRLARSVCSKTCLLHAHSPILQAPRARTLTSQSGPRSQLLQALQRRIDEDDANDDEDLKLEDHGNYSIVLPQDPLAESSRRAPTRNVPSHIARPPYVPTRDLTQRIRQMRESVMPKSSIIRLGGEEEKKLREAARLAEETLKYAGTLVQEGVTTDEIDAKVHEYVISHGAYPSPLLYKGFPKSCCTSVNNIMVHGIPDDRPLQDGDIINIDITIYLDGYHGDTSKTFLVGNVDESGRSLVHVTEQALEAGIASCAPSRPFRDIGKAIHNFIKSKHDADGGFTTSAAFTGHGIGTAFHTLPWIVHTPNVEPGTMQPGHCFTIEPCIVRGTNADHMVFGDGWTVSSTNWARSAQAEHMVLITHHGAEVITRNST